MWHDNASALLITAVSVACVRYNYNEPPSILVYLVLYLLQHAGTLSTMSTAQQNENNADIIIKHPCAICGKESETRCSQCRCSWYCGRACQKKDWKQHKKTCFPANSTCTRCLEPISTSGITSCCVPHPEHLLDEMGKSFGGRDRITKVDLACNACQRTFSKSQKGDETDFTFDPPSAQWCYHGPHTIKPIEEGDERRICRDIMTIDVSEGDTTAQVQHKINQLASTDVRILVIQAADFPEHVKPKLDIRLPKLEQIKILNVSFQKIVLNAQKTPKLRTIEHQNIPDDCNIEIKCPLLEEFNGRYHHGDCEWVQEMLDAATQLKIFQSYKLGVDEIQFRSSRDLRQVHLHRSDCCSFVSISGPNLEYVRLQGCYSLDRLTFPPGQDDLNSSQFVVETTNSCLSNQVVRMLTTHPRVQWNGDEEDEYAGVGGSGMEATFRQFHQQGW